MEFESDADRKARVIRQLRGEAPIRNYDRQLPTFVLNEQGRPMTATEMARGENYKGLTIAPQTEGPIVPSKNEWFDKESIMNAVRVQGNSAQNNFVGDIWRNLFGGESDENTEALAYKAGKALGIQPQALLDNPELRNEAIKAYQGQRTRDFLQDRPFTPATLKELYPEVDASDPVAASMALRDYNDILGSRRTIDQYSLTVGNDIAESWRAGMRDYDASMIMAQNMDGTLSDEETVRQLRSMMAENDRYEKLYGNHDWFVGATIRNMANMARTTYEGAKQLVGQLGPQGAMMLREIARYAPGVGAVAGGAMAAAGLPFAGVPLAAAGVISGVGILAMSTFLGSYKQMAAQNYWSMRTRRNASGQLLYTREEAIRRARTQAFWQAGLETVGAEVALFGPISKVFGRDAAAALIQNTMARNALLSAGKAELRRESLKQFGKQFALGASAEIAEEGLQQAVSDIDETVFGNDPRTGGQIFWNAVEAMVQAAPAVIGMVLPGAAIRGGVHYSAMKSLISKPGLHDAVEEYKRENEKAMTAELVEKREQSPLFRKSPEVYAQTIQKQMDRAGKNTLYVDAASAAETEQGQAALNELIDKKVVTAKEVTDAVSSGTALEIKPGVYMQEVSEQTAQTLSDHSTFDKGGRTLAAIKEARKRMKKARDAMTETREDREAHAVQSVLDRDFKTESPEKEAMREVLADNLYDVKGSLSRAIEEVKQQIAQIADVQNKIDYIRNHRTQKASNVGLVDVIGDEGQYEWRRVTANEGWYSAFYREHKKAPTIRDAYDIAYDEAMEEINHSGDPDAKEAGEALTAAMEKLRTLEGLTAYADRMDKDDLITRAQMDEEAYSEIYRPALEALMYGNKEVTQAARDSAFLYAKMAEALHDAYHIPYADIAHIQLGGRPGSGYNQMAGVHARYAPTARLEEAKRMEAEGRNADDIWDTTGWMKGKDGRWRWEIPDYMNRIDLEQMKDLKGDEALYLSEIYQNARLFDAYPWLGDVMVVTRDIEGTTLGFASRDAEGRPYIGINRKWLNGNHDREIRETVVHEIQHLIQDREGFARGGNTQHVVQQVQKEIDKLKAWMNETPERKTYVEMVEEANRLWGEKGKDDEWTAAEEKLEAYKKKLPAEEINTVRNRLETLHNLQFSLEHTERPEILYWNLAGEEEAREASRRAGQREDVRVHYADALGRSLRYREEMREGMKGASEEDRKRLEQFLDERENWSPDNRETDEEADRRIDRWEAAEAWITGGEVPEAVAEAYSNYDLALGDLSYTQREEEGLRDRPYIHGGRAVVVMNGQELPFSERVLDDLVVDSPIDPDELNVTEISGDEFGSYENIGELREKAEKYFAEQIQRSNAYNPIVGKIRFIEENKDGLVRFNRNGRKKLIQTSAREEKLLSTKRLKDIIYNANVVSDSMWEKEKHKGERFYYLHGAIDFNGEKKYVIVNIEEMTNGDLVYKNHAIYEPDEYEEKKNGINSRILRKASTDDETLVPSSTNNIAKGGRLYKTGHTYKLRQKESDNPTYYQEAPETAADLVAYHNISEDNLKKSAKLGGLPVPSIAVTRKDIPFGDFGGITLIGTMDMIDPARGTNVYSRDAYTTRFPEILYGRPKEKDISEFTGEVNKYFAASGTGNMTAITGHFLRNESRQETEKMLGDQAGMKLMYFAEKGKPVRVPMKDRGPQQYADILTGDVLASLSRTRNRPMKYGSTAHKKLSDAVKAALDARAADLEEQIRAPGGMAFMKNMARNRLEAVQRERAEFLDADGLLPEEKLKALYEEVRSAKRQVVDEDKLKAAVNKDNAGFRQWLSEKLDGLYGAPQIQIGKRKAPLTLDNIVQAMSRNSGAGQEDNISFPDNEVLAMGAQLFRSVDEMHESEGTLAENRKDDPAYAAFKDAMGAFQDAAVKAYKYPGGMRADFDARNGANRALASAFRRGKPTAAQVAEELKKQDIRAASNSEVVRLGMAVLEAARKVTTDYFEAKPERAVRFNEFAAAVVPKGTGKDTVEFLKKQGLRVVKYDPEKPGDRQAVTQRAAEREKVYFQQYRGAYDAANNVIHIFNGADQSTVVHEAAHFYLSTLENITASGAASQAALDDLDAIRSWAAFSEEHLAEYKGTDIEKEFAKHAAAIREAKTDEERRAAEERWMQERFARGFERYLMTGKAPTKETKSAFRRFKDWLTTIYKEVTRLGLADPPENVRAIFDKMVGTKEEIDAWAAEKRLSATDMGIDYDATEQENIRRWAEEVKERAKEKALQYFMNRAKEDSLTQFDNTLQTMREQWKEQLVKENPVYQLETVRPLFTESDWNSFLAGQGYDQESFDAAIAKAGGHLEDRLDKMVEDGRKQYMESALTPDMMRQIAEEELASPEGRALLADIEAGMLRKRINRYIRTAAASMMQLDRTADVKTISREIRERNGLLTEEEKRHAEKGALEERAADAETEKAQLRQQLADLMNGLRQARDALNYKKSELRTQAEWELSGQTVSKATNWKWWDNKAQAASHRAAAAIRKNDWSGAAQEKLNEMHYAMMSRVAREYEQNIRKALRGDPKTAAPEDQYGMARYGILGIINRIGRTEKPVRMTDMSRFFVQHMAFQLGLSSRDAVQPVDRNGHPIPFTWAGLARELNPTQAMTAEEAGGVYLGDDVIAGWMKSIFERKGKTLISTITYDQFRDVVEAIKAAYSIGRREYDGNTLMLHGKKISFDKAAEALLTSTWTHAKENPKYAKLRAGTKERIARALGKAVDELTQPEIIFERLGPEWYELFYQNIDRHTTLEREMTETANAAMLKNIKMYSRMEWQRMRSEKAYTFGTDENGNPVRYTKENLLAMALNWGNRQNRERIVETMGQPEGKIEDFLFENLTTKDWDFVEGVWAHINSYWDQRNAVQNHLYGVPLGKSAGITFTLPSGRTIHGMYYPIKYDPDTAVRTAELSANEVIQQQMQGVSTFTLGMGSTKRRAGSSNGQNVRLDLDVYLEHIGEAVHHIAMREATVDVYKLITRPDVRDTLVARVGIDTYNMLKQWAADQWHSPIDRMTSLEKFLMRLRGKMTFAAMAYRASTAILNIANINPLMDRMGAGNALHAIGSMYLSGDYREQRQFILDHSSFMRGRAVNLDRDLMRERKLPVGQHTWKGTAIAQGAADEVNKFGYAMIVETDFMLSMPEWMFTYRQARQELSGTDMTPEAIDAEAVRRADKAVRETFGSGEVKDQTAVVKGRIISQFLPFYSYTSLVLNQFIRAGYIKYDKGDIRPLVRAVFFWWILGSITEAAIRKAMAAASGDDKETFWQRLAVSIAGGGPVGGIPFARDIIPFVAADAMGVYRGDGKTEASALSVIDQGLKVYGDLTSDRKDWIDVGKDVTRMGNRIWRMSDTLTDGFWSLLRLLSTDTDKTFLEILASLVLDKDVVKKGEKK